MTTRASGVPSALGLRERKKLKTRAAIREHALRLIRAQGYPATTVEQIAAAAEVSPSTFFRYFPTKEDAVLYDPYDPLLAEAFRAQPDDLRPLPALRGAIRAVSAEFPGDEAEWTRNLLALILTVPELRARFLAELARSVSVLADLVAERVGRPADDLAVRCFAGAVVGTILAVLPAAANDPAADVVELMDAALAHLEAGLPL
jgi:AcrR family transcriptional regulator